MAWFFAFFASVVGFALFVDRKLSRDDTAEVDAKFWAIVGGRDD